MSIFRIPEYRYRPFDLCHIQPPDEKGKGNYPAVYHETNFLNTDILSDVPDLFTGFFIDLRDVKTRTQTDMDKSGIIKHFDNLLNGNPDSKTELNRMIHPTTNAQYKRGI